MVFPRDWGVGGAKWVRRRLRMCIWKQWKTGRTRAANLMKLGIAEHEAFNHYPDP